MTTNTIAIAVCVGLTGWWLVVAHGDGGEEAGKLDVGGPTNVATTCRGHKKLPFLPVPVAI